jgi:NAD(P)-dependent dehydrogenase (short-subunit alcohol dehydrogenase family)
MKRVWMITGTSRGLGAIIAEEVIASGDVLVATACNQGSLAAFQGRKDVLTLALDVTDEDQVVAAVSAALTRFGRIDVLVNNAGYGFIGAIEEAATQEVEAIYRTNVFGLLNAARAVLPAMRAQRAGHIINMASMGGYQASPMLGIYGSTKFAVEGLSEALHSEMKPLGIHVTVVGPGAFRTDFLDASSLRFSQTEVRDYEGMREKAHAYAEANNHRQHGDPTKLAKTLLRVVALPDPPLRLPIGDDALRRIESKNDFVGSEIQRWRTVSGSTDFT